MRYWWVNQKQTYRHEVPGGYLWSPKRKSNGHRNPFYDFMREVAPGDLIFSFAGGAIRAIGAVRSHCYEAPKPLEFGRTGAYWENIGWRVDVTFNELEKPVAPRHHMQQIEPLLPNRYAPLQANGEGLQAVYLTALSGKLAGVLIDLVGREAHSLVSAAQFKSSHQQLPATGLIEWEEHELERLMIDNTLESTTRKAVVLARRGQGLFKQRVLLIEERCRITGVDRIEHLRASHCKPWRDSNNSERLDGSNGLLLTPSADHLFDRGFISFEAKGRLLISPVVHHDSLRKMGIDPAGKMNVGAFNSDQEKFLGFHRENVFLESKFLQTMG